LKKYFYVLFILLSFLLLFNCKKEKTVEDKSLETIKNKKSFIVGMDDSFPPMGFRDDSSNIIGFDVDLAKEVANRMGVNVVFKPVDWSGVVLSLQKGDIDVIWNGLTITDERKANIGFSKPYLKNRQVLVVLSDSEITSKDDLNGSILGLQLGSSSEIALDNNTELKNNLKEIKKYSDNVEALLDLGVKRIDAVLVDEIVARYYVLKKPELKVLSESLGDEEYGIGFRKQDISFMNEVDKILDVIKTDGKGEEISNKWFGTNIMY